MRTTGDLGGAEGWGRVKTPTADEPVRLPVRVWSM